MELRVKVILILCKQKKYLINNLRISRFTIQNPGLQTLDCFFCREGSKNASGKNPMSKLNTKF